MGRTKNQRVTTKPLAQLYAIVDLLDRARMSYWADFGTLLGLVREGKIIDGDGDIDLSILENDLERFKTIIPSILELGYNLEIRRFDGQISQYKFRPAGDIDQRPVDVCVFKVTSGYAWCPCSHRIRGGSLPARILRSTLQVIRKQLIRHLHVFTLTADVFPWSFLMRIGTWWIPAELVAETVLLPNTRVRGPKRYEEYIELHYGSNWRVPDSAWNFKTDDGALHHEEPSLMVARLIT